MTERKLRHTAAVSRTMRDVALLLGWDEERADEMLVLGFVHDIGYDIDPEKHGAAGAEVLGRCGFAYADEVRMHGTPTDDPSPELALLWYADMTCDHEGEHCDYAQRLEGVRERYGDDSPQLEKAQAIVAWLEANFPVTPAAGGVKTPRTRVTEPVSPDSGACTLSSSMSGDTITLEAVAHGTDARSRVSCMLRTTNDFPAAAGLAWASLAQGLSLRALDENDNARARMLIKRASETFANAHDMLCAMVGKA